MLAISSKSIQALTFSLAVAIAITVWSMASHIEPQFALLGLLGAIFANATGAGGGVVFIPTFHQLGLSEEAAIATSFGIQTFGMTAGSVAWLTKYYLDSRTHVPASVEQLKLVLWVTGLVTLPSIAGLYSVDLFGIARPATLANFFAWFSIALGLCILATVFFFKPNSQFTLHRFDLVALVFIGFLGGMITAWLSVGVGELVAFYLIARGSNPATAIASAVVITALSVWSVVPSTFSRDSAAVLPIILAAGPAALLGGLSARYLVERLSRFWLKVFFGSWLILIGLVT